MENNKLAQVVKAIVSQQKSIIGPMAVELANRVPGLKISGDLATIETKGQPGEVLTGLVGQYQKLFGKASVEACKEAVRDKMGNLSTKDLPTILQ